MAQRYQVIFFLALACGSPGGSGIDDAAPSDSHSTTYDGKPRHDSSPSNFDGGIDLCAAQGNVPGVCPGRGLYEELPVVTLDAPAGTILRVSWDGSDPAQGSEYFAPLQVPPPSQGVVTTLRIAAIKDGEVLREVAHSYVWSTAVITQAASHAGFPTEWGTETKRAADYQVDSSILAGFSAEENQQTLAALPWLVVNTPLANLWDPQTGIYMNPEAEGVAWERPVNVEWLNDASTPAGGFSQGAGLRIQGGSSTQDWKNAKLSMRLLWKTTYGAAKLEYPIFPDSTITSFNTLVLDAGLNLTWLHPDHAQRIRSQYVRDQYVSDLQNSAGSLAPHGRFVHLLLGGLYWGVYDLHERPDNSFAASYLGGAANEYDVLRHVGNDIVDGDAVAWNQMMTLARAGLSENANYDAISQLLDIDDFITYMLINLYTGNEDWPHHNWYAARRRSEAGRFRFFSWDAEHTLKDVNRNQYAVNAQNGPGELWQALRGNATFLAKVAARKASLIGPGGLLYVDPEEGAANPTDPSKNSPAALYLRRAEEVRLAIRLESARWGDNRRTPAYTYADWQAELDWLLTQYFPARTAIFSQQGP